MKAVLLISHGSRSEKTKQEVEETIKLLKKDLSLPIVEYAFLELESPSIPQGIATCVKKGAKEIIVLLNFLNSGKHVDEDIPGIVKEAQAKYPQVKIRITRPVGQHPNIIKLFKDLISH